MTFLLQLLKLQQTRQNNFTYISSIGASIKASSLYLKNKGLVEQELNEMNFTKLSIIRPSIFLVKENISD